MNEQIVLGLDTSRTVKQMNADIRKLQNQLVQVKATGGLDSRATVKRINAQITALQSQLKAVSLKTSVDASDAQKTGREIGQTISDSVQEAIDSKNVNIDKLNADIEALANNLNNINPNDIVNKSGQSEVPMRGLNRLAASLKDQFSQAAQSLKQWLSVGSGITFLASRTKEAVSEIRELDKILTEIGKTSDMTSQQLKQMGMDAYDTAGKYGRTAGDYLLEAQKMAQSGFFGEKGAAMAELSLLAQSAGDMSAELASSYILATNAAYGFNGEADKLNAVLDGQNSITNRNHLAMEDMAAAVSEAGAAAAGFHVSIEDLSAMAGTIEALTNADGSEIGSALKEILTSLQDTTSDKTAHALNAAGISITEFVNGAERLRSPIDILRDLAEAFSRLDEDDPLREEVLTGIGQQHADKLGALLQNMDLFDKMLVDYSEGSGSALEASNKNVESLAGSINKLSNSWTMLVNSIVGSDDLKGIVKILDSLVQGAAALTSNLGSLGTIGLGAGIFAGVKNAGKTYKRMVFNSFVYLF